MGNIYSTDGRAAVLALAVLMKRVHNIKTDEKPEIFSLNIFKRLMTVAVPSILQQSFVSVGNLFIQALINSYGSDVIAGYSAAIKLNTFAIVSITTLGSGVSSFAAQNYGAGLMDRVRLGFKAGIKMVAAVALVITAFYVGISSMLMGFFIDLNEVKAVDVGIIFLRIVSPFYVVCWHQDFK